MSPTRMTCAAILAACFTSAAVAAPNAPQIAWMPGTVDVGTPVTVTWNMWWGENGDHWRLLSNGNELCEGSLTPSGQNAQSGSCSTSFAGGDHSLVAELCNADGCSASNPVAITAVGSGGPGDPGEPGEPGGGFDPWTDLDTTGWPMPLKQHNQPYSQSSGKQVAGYFVEWGIYGRDYHTADIPARNLSHIYYGFIPVCGPNDSLRQANPEGYSALQRECRGKQDYEVVVHDSFAALEKSYPNDSWDQPIRGIFAEFYRLKKTNPDVVILPSVGGWTLSDPLYDIGTDPAARAVFIDSMIAFIQKYDFFDGIDIDWEFPGGGGAHPGLGSPQDADGFAVLMKELREALDALSMETGRTYYLAAAMSGGVQKLSNVNWEAAHPHMDIINLMTYDYYGAWSGVLGHQAGLYPAPDAAHAGFSADEGVQYMLSRGVPAEKISIGVAMYGRGWSNVTGASGEYPFTGTGGGPIPGTWETGIIDYKAIESDYQGGADGTGINGFQLHWDDAAKAHYLWNPDTGALITMDTPRSVMEKGNYVRQHGLGGIFAWELDADNGRILNSMNEGVGNQPE